MEKIKDPAMILSIANSVGLVGITAYFYKQLEAIRADMIKMSSVLTGALRKLSEMEKGEQGKSEALHTLNDQIKRINESIEQLPTFESVDDMGADLSEIVQTLSDNNINVELPSYNPRPRRSGDRRGPRRQVPDVDERIEAASRRTMTRSSDVSARRQPPRPQAVRNEPRQESRDRVETRQDARYDARSEPGDNGDDLDLIGEVRKQQSRI